MATIQVLDAYGQVQTVQEPSAPGRAPATASKPVVFSTEDATTQSAILAALTTPSDVTLLTASSTTGSSRPVVAGWYNFVVYGTWDGATATLQFTPDGGTTWIDATAFTADGAQSGIPFGGCSARVAISGAGGSTSLTAAVLGVSR